MGPGPKPRRPVFSEPGSNRVGKRVLKIYLLYRLQAVQNRPGVRATLAEKFVEIFNWYEADLEEVHRIYEQHKVGKSALCL